MTDTVLETLLTQSQSTTGESSRGALVSGRTALADAALRRSLGAAGLKLLARGKHFAVVIEVPSTEWIEPISDSVKRIAPGSVKCVTGPAQKSLRASKETQAGEMLAEGAAVVGVSHPRGTPLPQVLVAVATHKFTIQPADAELVALAMKRCQTGRMPAALKDLKLEELDFNLLASCLCRGASKVKGLARLRQALDLKERPASPTLPLPKLEDAVEFGEARRWGLQLKADLADLRAGKISWRDVDRGAILEGPPGSGKTTFARVLGEACGVPTILGSISELFATSDGDLDGVIKAQRKLFTEAAEAAPSILFLDEINALPNPATISSRGRDWWLPVIYDFYLLLDSAMSSRAGIVVIGATNLIDDISPALLRPGRLERSIHIGPLTPEGFINVVRTQLANELADADLQPLAQAGEGTTAAVVMDWIRTARRTARAADRALTLADLRAQILPTDTRSDDERYRCAVHEAGHAVVSLIRSEPVHAVSIRSHGLTGGWTRFASTGETLADKGRLESKVTALLGGLAAEAEILGSTSSGAGGATDSDLAKATAITAAIHTSFGLADSLVWRGAPRDAVLLIEGDPYLRTAVEKDLQRLFAEAKALIGQNRDRVLAIADRLMVAGTIGRREIATLAQIPEIESG